MMTIAEFAAFCGTTKDALRWYDKQGLLKPVHIGSNGYRYYDILQYEEYDLIRMLKESGSNLQDINAILSDKAKHLSVEFFKGRLSLIEAQIRELEAMRTLVCDMVDGFTAMDSHSPGIPVLVNIPGQWLLEVKLDKTNERNENDYIFGLMQLQKSVSENRNTMHLYPLGIKLSLHAAMDNVLEQTHFFHETDAGNSPNAVYRLGGPAVMIWHKGLYSDIFDTLHIAFRYIDEIGLRPCDAVYEYDFLTTFADKPENTTFRFTIPVTREESVYL